MDISDALTCIECALDHRNLTRELDLQQRGSDLALDLLVLGVGLRPEAVVDEFEY